MANRPLHDAALVIELDQADLPACCPPRRSEAWNQHPRVYLDFDATGTAQCPYCSTYYRLKPGVKLAGH